jgi:hypothetical protein
MKKPAAMSEFPEIVRRIEELNAPAGDFDDMVKQMHRLASICRLSRAVFYDPPRRIFRVTTHHTALPPRIEELWFPPPIADFSRASPPGTSVFYGCSDPNGALREVRVKAGQHVILAEWGTTATMLVHPVGYSETVFERAGARRAVDRQHVEFEARLSQDERSVRNFLMAAFTDPTPNRYRITAAIATLYGAVDGVALSGLMYPSIEKSANVDNFALAPKFVRSSMILKAADLMLVDTVDESSGDIQGSREARMISVTDGNLKWAAVGEKRTELPPMTRVSAELSEGEKLRLQDVTGLVEIDGTMYFVKPGYTVELVGGSVVVRDLRGDRVSPAGVGAAIAAARKLAE